MEGCFVVDSDARIEPWSSVFGQGRYLYEREVAVNGPIDALWYFARAERSEDPKLLSTGLSIDEWQRRLRDSSYTRLFRIDGLRDNPRMEECASVSMLRDVGGVCGLRFEFGAREILLSADGINLHTCREELLWLGKGAHYDSSQASPL